MNTNFKDDLRNIMIRSARRHTIRNPAVILAKARVMPQVRHNTCLIQSASGLVWADNGIPSTSFPHEHLYSIPLISVRLSWRKTVPVTRKRNVNNAATASCSFFCATLEEKTNEMNCEEWGSFTISFSCIIMPSETKESAACKARAPPGSGASVRRYECF